MRRKVVLSLVFVSVLLFSSSSGVSSASFNAFSAYDAGSTDGLNTKGYAGAVFDHRYVYFAPYYDGSNYHGRVLRYDVQGSFTGSASWDAYDAGNTAGLVCKGYLGAVFAGRYVYFAPYYDGVNYHGRALQYDVQGSFFSSGSWNAYDAGSTDGLNTKGYSGAVFDGRYVFFTPHSNGMEANFHGRVLRYDSQGGFTDSASWDSYDAGSTDGLNTKGYSGAVFDGRYIYFVPYRDDSSAHGRVLRYDAIIPDIAVTDIAVSGMRLVEGCDLRISITLVNQGYETEVFNVTAFLNGRPVESFQNVLLEGGKAITLNTTWGAPRGRNTISVYVTPVPLEIDTLDNTLNYGTILVAPYPRGRNLNGPIIQL